MEYLAHRHGEVPAGFKILRDSCEVPRMDSPVGVEVIEPGCIWSTAC